MDEVRPSEAAVAHALASRPVDEVIEESAAEIEETVASEDVPAEDLAWLDTLGEVDVESWLEAEADVEQMDVASESVEVPEIEFLETTEENGVELRALATILPDVDAAEELARARKAMQEGAVEEGLAVYSGLVEEGESLPFLIDDLEIFYEERGQELRLQRVLGDAYARNGQLQKALRVYREALDSL